MTTIAFDGQRLAVDSRVVNDTMICYERAKKLWFIRGRWIAFCGSIESMMIAVQWFKAGMPKEKPQVSKNFGALAWDMRRRPVFYEDGLVAIPEGRELLAYGSGAHFALGAMAAGATAVEAVKIAARFDPNTNSRVQVSK